MRKRMRLVYFQPTHSSYIVRAQLSRKFLGVNLGKSYKDYILRKGEKNWLNKKNKKPISKREASYLNKWLLDHKKFIEK